MWTCSNCLWSTLPFQHNQSFIVNENQDLNHTLGNQCRPQSDNLNNQQDPHLKALNGKKGTSIGHLNTRSLCSSFVEFQWFMETYKFDIMTLSETWLKNDQNVLNYVNIQGYNVEYRNRDKKRGGRVGMYIKSSIKYLVRKDIIRLDQDLEHLWVEVKGKNKNHSFLVASIYQPHSDNNVKDAWISKFEALLSKVNNIWNGPIMICGDTDINLLTTSTQSELFRSKLDSFELKNVVEKPT